MHDARETSLVLGWFHDAPSQQSSGPGLMTIDNNPVQLLRVLT